MYSKPPTSGGSLALLRTDIYARPPPAKGLQKPSSRVITCARTVTKHSLKMYIEIIINYFLFRMLIQLNKILFNRNFK